MKKENTKIMLWAVVALVLGVLIGLLINIIAIGNTSRVISKNNQEMQIRNITIDCGCNNAQDQPCKHIYRGDTSSNTIIAGCKSCCLSGTFYDFEIED
jgi:uncharacterized protein YneF (UPF0154 family)